MYPEIIRKIENRLQQGLTSAHEDDIGLGITTVDDVAALGDTILGGARQVGHGLTGEGHDGGAGVALLVHALAVLNCNL